ncbi:hypothetical protein ISN45_Aa04g006930 [Arabidopsis thaliana x Arabidopsis arenosa]|uniref:Retrotransposon gag domain-containing protein n=1 Tax=Arabidopsis thaliana x Arabidopsis arenosa TaxID=1240361 RepID=A0A8T2A7E0_9BRAS|nr:hypothetical protein ISN45_Aa04g006930 [Arabidopsis thaliana x Arabidopsis arenosa]
MMLILRPDAAGVLRDRDGQAYNEDGQRIAEHGYVIPEIAQGVDPHQLGVARHHGVNRADGRQMTLGDYNSPDLFFENRRAIRPSAFERSDDLGLQPAFYTLVSQHPFHGLPHEQPMDHIERFEDLVSIIKARVVSEAYLHRKLFSYSLAGEAASWLKELISGSLTTWQETKMAFLNNFTRNYCSYSYQAPSPPTSRQCRPTPVPKSEKSHCDEAELTYIDTDLQDPSTRSLCVDRHHLGVYRHSSSTEVESTFDEAESSELGTEESTPDSSVDRHSPSLQDPLQDYIKKMITNRISADDVSLLTKDISAILVYEDPEKKPTKRLSVAISELVSSMIECCIPEKLPDPERFVLDCSISTDITARYVKELDSIEQVKLQASKLEDWSGDHLFSTRIQDEAQLGDKLLQIAEPHCRNSAEFRAADFVSIDTTMVSVDTSFDETDLCRPQHLAVDTKPRHTALESIDTIFVDRHPTQAEPAFSNKESFRAGITAMSPGIAVTSTTAPLLLHPLPKQLRYSRSPPKPPDFLNMNFKFFKTVSRLSKPRVSRRALVCSFDDCVGKRSIPPIPKSRPADVTYFHGQPHAPTAYTPPWMMRRFSRKYLLPPSDPPDA